MILYISGVHGAGKSTLAAELAAQPSFALTARSGHTSSNDPYERLLYRLDRYAEEAALDTAKHREADPTIWIRDRGVLDWIAYVDAFQRVGWITDVQSVNLLLRMRESFDRDWWPRTVAFLDPPSSFVEQCLHRRWKSSGKRWGEDEPGFTEASQLAFRSATFASGATLLRVSTTSLRERVRLVSEWALGR